MNTYFYLYLFLLLMILFLTIYHLLYRVEVRNIKKEVGIALPNSLYQIIDLSIVIGIITTLVLSVIFMLFLN